MKPTKTFSVKKLARYAFNQLLSGIELSEVYDNLNIFERLNNDEDDSKFELQLNALAAKHGYLIKFDYLQPMTKLEAFFNQSASNVTATFEGDLQVTLACNGSAIKFSLNEVPKLIKSVEMPAATAGMLSKLYFVYGEAK